MSPEVVSGNAVLITKILSLTTLVLSGLSLLVPQTTFLIGLIYFLQNFVFNNFAGLRVGEFDKYLPFFMSLGILGLSLYLSCGSCEKDKNPQFSRGSEKSRKAHRT